VKPAEDEAGEAIASLFFMRAGAGGLAGVVSVRGGFGSYDTKPNEGDHAGGVFRFGGFLERGGSFGVMAPASVA
jgi:hypothetical protein